jgi:flagellar protein FliO/FliZ
MSVGRRFLAVVVAAWLFAGAAWAADDNKVIYPGSSPRSETAAPAAGGMNSLTLVLGVVLAGVGGWFVWRNRHRVAPGRGEHALAVEETRALGNKQFLVVASYEGKKFLLGVCPGRIDLLAPLDGTAASRAKADE